MSNAIALRVGGRGRNLLGGVSSRLRPRRPAMAAALLVLLGGCAREAASAVEPGAPGFLYGVWHGFIFPIAWIISLFSDEVAVYAVPNNGGWYDFGYFVGIVVIGVGARKSHTVYRDRVIVRDRSS